MVRDSKNRLVEKVNNYFHLKISFYGKVKRLRWRRHTVNGNPFHRVDVFRLCGDRFEAPFDQCGLDKAVHVSIISQHLAPSIQFQPDRLSMKQANARLA